ncbi:MAG TPA: MATE family efflux transporter, partial [Lactobacillus sp.]|nr:MATE family efflux transporter [Lactobacillus sp.]
MHDLTEGNPIKLIFLFTMPLLIGNLFQQLYNISDTLVVGQTLGVNALAAVGSTGSISFLIIGFAQGLTAGLSIVTAQRFGARDLKGVRESFAASIWISLFVTIVLTVLSLAFVHPILHLMQTPTAIYHDALVFISIIFAGIFASVGFNLLSNMIRGLGDSRTPLYFLIIGTIVN